LDFREQGEQMMVRDLMIGAVVLAASAGQTLAQDLTAGEASFRKCQPCHDIGETAKNKLGPELNGLDGRKAGTVENGTYSQGMKNSGITWNEQAFREFVSDSAAKVPGTMMLLSVRDEKEIGDLWAYLKQFGADGKKRSQ
jgi:cytochrome c